MNNTSQYLWSSSPRYSDKDEESIASSSEGLISGIVSRTPRTKSWKWSTPLHWIGHILLLASVLCNMLYLSKDHGRALFLKSEEEIYSDIRRHVAPEIRSMDPHYGPDNVRDESWIGPFDRTNVELWESITTLGVVSISDKEQARLGFDTSRANDTNEYFIVPQAFHALHCLKRIRESYWGGDDPRFVLDDTKRHHLDHCVDNFRQNLMCNADLTPIPFHWGGDKHRADYDVPRVCRNWNLIREWALKRNTTGYVL